MLIKLVNFLLCRGQLSKPIEGQILAPKHKPEPFVLTLHKDSREMMVRRRPHSQDAKRLIRLRHRRLLNLGDDVAFLYPACGGRAGRRNSGAVACWCRVRVTCLTRPVTSPMKRFTGCSAVSSRVSLNSCDQRARPDRSRPSARFRTNRPNIDPDLRVAP
jgi:hypothetical protein